MTPSDVKRNDDESVEGGDVVVGSGEAVSASVMVASPAFEGSTAGTAGDSFTVADMISFILAFLLFLGGL